MRFLLLLFLVGFSLACSSDNPEGSLPTNDRNEIEDPEDFVLLESGTDSQYKSSGFFVFKSQSEWQDHYVRHKQEGEFVPTAPYVDFSREMVIAIHDELRDNTSWKVRLSTIAYDSTDGTFQVRYRKFSDNTMSGITRETYPYAFYVSGIERDTEYRFIEVP